MIKELTSYNYLQDYIDDIQSKGRYHFTRDDIKDKYKVTDEALKKALARLKSRNKIVLVHKDFYIIIPPEYSGKGILPPAMFINQMMNHLGKAYYVGLLNAAAYHGASHQQPQEFFVFTVKPAMRPTKVKGLKINYVIKSEIQDELLEEKKTETGFIKVSCPELTAMDLLQYESKAGGLNRAVLLIKELSDEFNLNRLKRVLRGNTPLSVQQRFGYIIDKLGDKKEIAKMVRKELEKKSLFRIPLQMKGKKAGYPLDKKWQVIENTTLDTEE
jgi:predicted transcriptional regulator of viral defense system